MSQRIFKDGCRCVITSFEVRTLDQHGDADNVDHYESKEAALQEAKRAIKAGVVAVVVEKHVTGMPAHMFADPSTYVGIATFGDRLALMEGGWL